MRWIAGWRFAALTRYLQCPATCCSPETAADEDAAATPAVGAAEGDPDEPSVLSPGVEGGAWPPVGCASDPLLPSAPPPPGAPACAAAAAEARPARSTTFGALGRRISQWANKRTKHNSSSPPAPRASRLGGCAAAAAAEGASAVVVVAAAAPSSPAPSDGGGQHHRGVLYRKRCDVDLQHVHCPYVAFRLLSTRGVACVSFN